MIHEAYMPVYIGSRFSLRTGARAGPPEVVQEALADLKTIIRIRIMKSMIHMRLDFMVTIRLCFCHDQSSCHTLLRFIKKMSREK